MARTAGLAAWQAAEMPELGLAGYRYIHEIAVGLARIGLC